MRLLRTVASFLIVHAVVLVGTALKSLEFIPQAPSAPRFWTALLLICSHLRELVVLAVFYILLARLFRSWGKRVSSVLLICLVPITVAYYAVCVKTRAVYGLGFLTEELLPFVLYFIPSYLEPAYVVPVLVSGGALAISPWLLSWGIDRYRIVGSMVLSGVGLCVSLGMFGYLLTVPPDVPRHVRSGPLCQLALSTWNEYKYPEGGLERYREAEKLLRSSFETSVTAEWPDSFRRLKPVRKVIVYLLEGIPESVFSPDSKYAGLFPRLTGWTQHAVQFKNYYATSTLTAHAYMTIGTGGYIRSGSRLEMPQVESMSLIRTLVEHKFETAFFCSIDLEYHGTARFLERMGFNQVISFTRLGQGYRLKGMNVDDIAVVDAFRKWVRGKEQFLVVLNPTGTHDPYWNPDGDPPSNVEGSVILRRFLSSVIYQDKVLGELVDFVNSNHPDALVIILSDHGIREYVPELEGTNPPYSGFSSSFEARFHVPLYFYNRHAFSQPAKSGTAMSHVDLLPTILSLMAVQVDSRPAMGSDILLNQPRIRFLNTLHNLDVMALIDDHHKFLLNKVTGEADLFTCDKTGEDWRALDFSENGERKKHYEELLTAWHEYLTR